MDIQRRETIPMITALGRNIWCAMGTGAPLDDTVRCGFTRFSLAQGKMIPHCHEREIILVLDAKGCTAKYGSSKASMPESRRLQGGDLLRFHDGEWHVFEMDDEESYLDIFFVFSVPQNHTIE